MYIGHLETLVPLFWDVWLDGKSIGWWQCYTHPQLNVNSGMTFPITAALPLSKYVSVYVSDIYVFQRVEFQLEKIGFTPNN